MSENFGNSYELDGNQGMPVFLVEHINLDRLLGRLSNIGIEINEEKSKKIIREERSLNNTVVQNSQTTIGYYLQSDSLAIELRTYERDMGDGLKGKGISGQIISEKNIRESKIKELLDVITSEIDYAPPII